MRNSAVILLALGFVVAIADPAQAQVGRAAAQVFPLVETDGVRAGAPMRLALRVVLPEEMHVQSNTPRDPALIPTVLTIEAPAGITIDEIIYPAASDLKQQGLPQPLAVYGRDFTIGVRAAIGAHVVAGPLAIKARLRYQACNDKVCFAPLTAEVTWTLRVVPASAAIAAQHREVFAQLPRTAGVPAAEPAPTPRTIVAMTRAAMAEDFTRAEKMVKAYQAAHGVTPEMLLAHSWLGRGALGDQKLDVAEAYARETHALGLAELKRRPMDAEATLPTAFGAAIEVLGKVAAERGKRSEAIAFLNDELKTYGNTSLHKRIQKNINLLNLEGTVAPPLDLFDHQGVTPPALEALKGRVVLLFFWAHWCSDCKAQGPVLEMLLRRYGTQDLTVIAPTQRYGYVAGGTAAPAEEEARYIREVRQTSYPWMAQVPVTLNEANHQRYGVSSTPTLVLVDRAGIVRLYHPGQMTEAQLEPLVRRLVEEKANRTSSAGR